MEIRTLRYFLAGRPAPSERPAEKPIYNFESEKPRPEIDHEEFIYI